MIRRLAGLSLLGVLCLPGLAAQAASRAPVEAFEEDEAWARLHARQDDYNAVGNLFGATISIDDQELAAVVAKSGGRP